MSVEFGRSRYKLVGDNIPKDFTQPFDLFKFFKWLVENDKTFRDDFTEAEFYEYYKKKGWRLVPHVGLD